MGRQPESPESINTVGLLYYYGKGVPKDPREATIWFHHAAELEHAAAQWNLAGMYYRGDGAPQDDAQVVRWCRRAAEQDCPPAQNSLAPMYADGRGVLADDTEAARWYRRAAAQGYAKAQFNLAELYYVGRGVLRDYAKGDTLDLLHARLNRPRRSGAMYRVTLHNLGILVNRP